MLKILSLGAIQGTGVSWLGIRLWSTKDASKGLCASGPKGLEPNYYLHLQHQAFLEYMSELPIQFLNHILKLSAEWYVTGVLKTSIGNKGEKVIFSWFPTSSSVFVSYTPYIVHWKVTGLNYWHWSVIITQKWWPVQCWWQKPGYLHCTQCWCRKKSTTQTKWIHDDYADNKMYGVQSKSKEVGKLL